jgi:hypothetical protein
MLGGVFMQRYRRPRSVLHKGSRGNRRWGKSRNRTGKRVRERYSCEHDCSYRDNIWPSYGQMDNA